MQDIKFPQYKKMLGILNISKILIWNATRWLYGDIVKSNMFISK